MEKIVKMDESRCRKYMSFYKFRRSAQGMAIYGDRAFILYDMGMCGVYDLASKSEQPLAQFPLGSYNEGTPTRDYLNHANSCIFSDIHRNGNPIPLLYVTIGTGTGYDDDGFYYRCAVEDIRQEPDGSYHAETVQIIAYHPAGQLPQGTEQPCFGCPCIMIDNDERCLYMFGARHRTKREYLPEDGINTYIITKFPLPDPEKGGLVRLTPEDMQKQFTVRSRVMFTQGGGIANHKLYYTFGCPKIDYPLHLMQFDLEKECLMTQLDELPFNGEEVECCDFYNGKLLCNTCDGSIFEIDPECFDEI